MHKHSITLLIYAIGLGTILLMVPQSTFGQQVPSKYSPDLTERLNDPRLLAAGQTRIYHGPNLEAISLPVGGIGAGCIQFNGRAERAIWQIFNNFNTVSVPHSFFAVRAKAADSQPVVRTLQTGKVGPFKPMQSLAFRGEFPFGWYDFADSALPVAVSMETFSLLIPMNVKDSAIPCAIFNLTAKNTSDEPVEVSFLASQQNAVGFDGRTKIDSRLFSGYGGNGNRILKEKDSTILHMTSNQQKDSPGYGDMALVAFGNDNVTATASWSGFDTLLRVFSEDGKLNGTEAAGPSPAGQTLDGAIAVPFTLQPGQTRTVRFALTWYFPNCWHGSKKFPPHLLDTKWYHQGNMYTNWWSDALDVASYLNDRIDQLESLTRLYHDTFYSSNLPHWLLDRISSQVVVLYSKTCFWSRDGYFGGWEGTNRDGGNCPGNCSHVWQYAQTHARLFPAIARKMREQDFQYQHPNGAIPERHPDSHPAFDGQCGDILASYREHLLSSDSSWLNRNWPNIKKAMNFTISRWDKDNDGILAGQQWNTLDGNLGGSTSWLGTLYLAALQASEKMAKLQSDNTLAAHYRRIRLSGADKQNQTLFNGEYYIQLPDAEPRRDYGNGCHIDQVLGEWWANQLGLEPHYPLDRLRTAMHSLFKYNFRTNFHGFKQKPRKYVDDNDAGTLMITWPKADRPANHILYADEVWTGTEYSAAATMLQTGLLKEGLAVVLAASDRYDGRLRYGVAAWGTNGNPFCDEEAGKFYVRPMSIWSMLLACQGFVYDGPAGVIGFKPVWRPDDHISFFTVARGWGLFSQKRNAATQTHRIELTYGTLTVNQLLFELPAGAKPADIRIEADGKSIASSFNCIDGRLTIQLAKSITLRAGQSLAVVVHIAK